MKDYMKVKITKITCKFALKLLRSKKFSKNYQKKGTRLAKHLWQNPYLPRFYTTSKLQALSLLQRCRFWARDLKLFNKGIPIQSEVFSKTFKGKLSFQSMSSSSVYFIKIEDRNYMFQT